jgi:hypothetical protein
VWRVGVPQSTGVVVAPCDEACKIAPQVDTEKHFYSPAESRHSSVNLALYFLILILCGAVHVANGFRDETELRQAVLTCGFMALSLDTGPSCKIIR